MATTWLCGGVGDADGAFSDLNQHGGILNRFCVGSSGNGKDSCHCVIEFFFGTGILVVGDRQGRTNRKWTARRGGGEKQIATEIPRYAYVKSGDLVALPVGRWQGHILIDGAGLIRALGVDRCSGDEAPPKDTKMEIRAG